MIIVCDFTASNKVVYTRIHGDTWGYNALYFIGILESIIEFYLRLATSYGTWMLCDVSNHVCLYIYI